MSIHFEHRPSPHCPLVKRRIACLECEYGYSEARYSTMEEYLSEQVPHAALQ